jgi:hypothetical protein
VIAQGIVAPSPRPARKRKATSAGKEAATDAELAPTSVSRSFCVDVVATRSERVLALRGLQSREPSA